MPSENDPVRGDSRPDPEPNRPSDSDDSEAQDDDQDIQWTIQAPNGNGNHESSSEEEEEEDEEAPDGYQRLSQGPNRPLEEEEEEAETDLASIQAAIAAQSDTQAIAAGVSTAVEALAEEAKRAREQEEAAERARLFRDGRSKDIALDGGKVESIRRAMAGVELPEEAIPQWAKGMTDQQWKEALQKKLFPGKQ